MTSNHHICHLRDSLCDRSRRCPRTTLQHIRPGRHFAASIWRAFSSWSLTNSVHLSHRHDWPGASCAPCPSCPQRSHRGPPAPGPAAPGDAGSACAVVDDPSSSLGQCAGSMVRDTPCAWGTLACGGMPIASASSRRRRRRDSRPSLPPLPLEPTPLCLLPPAPAAPRPRCRTSAPASSRLVVR